MKRELEYEMEALARDVALAQDKVKRAAVAVLERSEAFAAAITQGFGASKLTLAMLTSEVDELRQAVAQADRMEERQALARRIGCLAVHP